MDDTRLTAGLPPRPARGPDPRELGAETDSGSCFRRLFDGDRFEEDSVIAGTGDHVVHLAGDDPILFGTEFAHFIKLMT